jgi:hypothetical protein
MHRLPVALALAATLLAPALHAYPLDGYAETGIRRLAGYRLGQEGRIEYPPQPAGSLLPTERIELRLLDSDTPLPPAPDPEFTAQVVEVLEDQADRYSLLVLDLSDPARPRFASHRAGEKQNVGSVGKLLGAHGLFSALAQAWPDDLDARARVLRESEVIADAFSQTDHHKIRIVDPAAGTLEQTSMRVGERGNLWEMLDWMLSASSNAAASMVMREAMLLQQLGQAYPIPNEERTAFFAATRGAELTHLFQRTFWAPVTAAGLDLDTLRQGSFFTRGGQTRVNGGGLSYATAGALLDWLINLERGRIVDPWSSLQIKRLLYLTERRIRYASSPALSRAAVYSKSGSLWSCQPEEGFTCKPYHGNRQNYMNSVSIIEEDAATAEGEPVRLYYMVVLISNVLRVNSAVTHQTMGTRIHHLIRTQHNLPPNR